MSQSSKENIHTIMARPDFDPWRTETIFTPSGMVSRELHRTTIRLNKGTSDSFISLFRQAQDHNQPYLLEFFSPAGLTMRVEIRGFSLPEEQCQGYDTLSLSVYLTPDQVLAFLPNDGKADFGY